MSKVYCGIIPNKWLNIPEYDKGYANGYVLVNEENPLYGKFYDDINISIHRELTYSKKCREHMFLQLEFIGEIPDKDSNLWLIGFDTLHPEDNSTNCNRDYVIAETLKLKELAENYK